MAKPVSAKKTPRAKLPRALLADENCLVAIGIGKLLERYIQVVGVVTSGFALIALARRLKPEIVLLDIRLPELDGVEAALQLKKLRPAAKIVFVTALSDPGHLTRALRAGASGYILKRSAPSELKAAVRGVLAGRRYVTPLISLAPPWGAAPGLTPRQCEVLQLVAEGRSSKEIAALLHVSVKAVEYHRAAIMQKLGVKTSAELVKSGIERGIIRIHGQFLSKG